MKEYNLEESTLNTFDIIHNYFFQNQKRHHDFENCSVVFIKSHVYRVLKNSNFTHYNYCLPIMYKAISLLVHNGFNDYDPNNIIIEFQRRNYFSYGKNKKSIKDMGWHYDDYEVGPFKVYTVIFYLRKDRTIRGGNLLYEFNNNVNEIKVSNGLSVIFSGDTSHTPQESYGFGCRDSIVVFIRRQ